MKKMFLNLSRVLSVLGLGIFISYSVHAKSTDVRVLEDFTELEASNGVHIVLQKCTGSENPEAKIEVDGLETKDVTTKSKGEGLLVISIKSKVEALDMSAKVKKQKVTVFIKYKNLEKIKVKTAASISLGEGQSELSAKALEITADSAGKVDLNISVSGDLKISSKAAAKVKLFGKASNVNIEAASGSSIDMSEIELKEAEINASSAGSVKVFVTKMLKATVNSLAKLIYSGNPAKVEIERGSMGTVKGE